MKNKRVMVTGGAGFLGSHLVDYLVETNAEKVVIVDNFFLGNKDNLKEAFGNDKNVEVKLYREDAGDFSTMRNIFDEENVDVVYDLAVKPLPYSFFSPETSFDTSVKVAQTLCSLQRKGSFKTLVHCSSSEAYGSAVYSPMDENHPLNPTTTYSAGKAAADLLCLSYYRTMGLDVRIVRPFNQYGERQNELVYSSIIPTTIKRLFDGQKPIIEWDGKQTRDFTYWRDTVRALYLAGEKNCMKGRLVNVCSGKGVEILEIMQRIMRLMNYDGNMIMKPARTGDVRHHCGSGKLAEELLDFKPRVGLGEGLANTVKWYVTKFNEGLK